MSEEKYYLVIKQKFAELFRSREVEVHLEITSRKRFSNKLKSKIPDHRHIIFYFLKEIAPDIAGFIIKDSWMEFIVIEVKNGQLKLDHIYQARKYAELFDARFAFLVSTEEIPEEMKRLSKVVYSLLSLPAYRNLILVYFNEDSQAFEDWYPENPFKNEYYWR